MKAFREIEYGNIFTYEDSEEIFLAPLAHGGRNHVYNQRVWIGNALKEHDRGWRWAKVMQTVAHVIVDEVERDGNTWYIVERWDIKPVH